MWSVKDEEQSSDVKEMESLNKNLHKEINTPFLE